MGNLQTSPGGDRDENLQEQQRDKSGQAGAVAATTATEEINAVVKLHWSTAQ